MMTANPLHAAAYAGKLAGIACEALLELLLPGDEPARVLDDGDGDGFDEGAADEYLRGGAPDCGLGEATGPYTLDAVYRSRGQLHEMPPRPLVTPPGPRRTDSDRLDHLIALVEDVRNLLPTPADDEARPVRGPSAGAAPRVDSTASVDGAGRPNVNWQLLASAQRAITHWLAGASCTQTAHWQSVADELRYTAHELRDQQHQLYPK